MKYLVLFFPSLFICLICCSQQQPARLIVRGDDMGYSHAGNEAIIKAYREGIERSAEIIVASPWFPEAVKLLNENPGLDVGVHLALTSEWDNIKWRPLSDCPSLRDEDGYFYPMIWPNKNYPGKALKENNWTMEDIEKEFRAQIELAKKKIPSLSHISAHMGCTELNDSVRNLTKKLAVEYGLDIDPKDFGVKGFEYEIKGKTIEEKVKGFIEALKNLQPGNTYIFVEHPGLDTDELRAIHHIGNETVAIDRQAVTSLWTNKDVKKAIKEKGIQLISYREVRGEK